MQSTCFAHGNNLISPRKQLVFIRETSYFPSIEPIAIRLPAYLARDIILHEIHLAMPSRTCVTRDEGGQGMARAGKEEGKI